MWQMFYLYISFIIQENWVLHISILQWRLEQIFIFVLKQKLASSNLPKNLQVAPYNTLYNNIFYFYLSINQALQLWLWLRWPITYHYSRQMNHLHHTAYSCSDSISYTPYLSALFDDSHKPKSCWMSSFWSRIWRYPLSDGQYQRNHHDAVTKWS